MNYNLFIDKYQPIFLDDFYLKKELFNLLKTLIQTNNLNILFIGKIGTGKTTLLNALIKEYYKDIDNYESNILKINTIKEHGINYYRNDVKSFCQTCSTIKNKKKIIIIDNLDLLNEQSQQIFRFCIDKYTSNINFISSCTNIQKVIENLKSRIYIINLEPLHKENIKKIFYKIQTNEQIRIEDDNVIEFILKISNHNIKIMINYMEKFKLLNDNITLDIAKKICSNISFLILEKYIQMVKESNLSESIKIIYEIYEKGYSNIDILDNLFNYIKITELLNDQEKYIFIQHICKYIAIFYNINEDIIELILFTNDIIKLFNK